VSAGDLIVGGTRWFALADLTVWAWQKDLRKNRSTPAVVPQSGR